MHGDVVRLREATTTTFSLEASEPAIAPLSVVQACSGNRYEIFQRRRIDARPSNKMRKPTRNKHGTLVYSKDAKFVLAFCLAHARDRLSPVLRHVNFGSHFLCVLVCICGSSRVWI
ncbi:unnamed protein product [Sphagnum jensenii]|uniref:Uncharacterized protein n=1 Tax=Sphagnum jensenii TaxID=128206 RepID=A0ABP1AM74_9BRYO